MHVPTAVQPQTKPKFSIVWVVLGIIALFIAVDSALGQAHRSGLQVDGQPISQADAKVGLREVVAITKDLRAGDPNSLHMGVEPQTVLGKRFKDLMVTAQSINNDYLQDTAEARSSKFLTPKELSTDEGRTEARQIHNDYMNATLRYRRASSQYQQDFASFMSDLSGQPVTQLGNVQQEDAQIAELDNRQAKAIENLLDFVDEGTPTYNAANNKLIFKKDADVARYSALVKDILRSQEELDKGRNAILANRQKAIQKDMSGLEQLTQS